METLRFKAPSVSATPQQTLIQVCLMLVLYGGCFFAIRRLWNPPAESMHRSVLTSCIFGGLMTATWLARTRREAEYEIDLDEGVITKKQGMVTQRIRMDEIQTLRESKPSFFGGGGLFVAERSRFGALSRKGIFLPAAIEDYDVIRKTIEMRVRERSS